MPTGQDALNQLEYQYGLPPGVLNAIWGQESGRGQNMLNRSSGAAGHFQLMEENSRAAGIDPNDFGASAEWTAKYAADALKRFPALDPVEAIAAHHYGGPNTKQWGPKTRKYVSDIRARLGKAPDVRMASAIAGPGEISDVTDQTPTGDPVTGRMDMPLPQGVPQQSQPPIADLVSARLLSMEGSDRLTKAQALERSFGMIANMLSPPWQQQALPHEPPRGLTAREQLQAESQLFTLEVGRRTQQREQEQQRKENEYRMNEAQKAEASGDFQKADFLRAGMGGEEELLPVSMRPEPDLALKAVIDPATGRPTYVREQEALGMEPFSKPQVEISTGEKLPGGYRWKDPSDLAQGVEPVPGGPAEQPTGEERKSRSYADRMLSAEATIDQLDSAPQVEGGLSRMWAQTAPNSLQTAEAQQYRNAADQWIRAKLRKESGAVIAADEMAQEYTTFFPVVGDGPEVVEQKRVARIEAMRALEAEAGRADPGGEVELTSDEKAELEMRRRARGLVQ